MQCQDTSSEGAAYFSPARKCRVRVQRDLRPAGHHSSSRAHTQVRAPIELTLWLALRHEPSGLTANCQVLLAASCHPVIVQTLRRKTSEIGHTAACDLRGNCHLRSFWGH